MGNWFDDVIGALAGALPYLLGVVGVLLVISLIDGHRRGNGKGGG